MAPVVALIEMPAGRAGLMVKPLTTLVKEAVLVVIGCVMAPEMVV